MSTLHVQFSGDEGLKDFDFTKSNKKLKKKNRRGEENTYFWKFKNAGFA